MSKAANVTVALLILVGSVAVWASAKEINFWTWESGERFEQVREILAQFVKENPGLTVAYDTRNVRHGEALLVAIAGGVAPDLVTTHQDFHRDFAGQGLFLDLRPYIERDGFDLSIFPAEVMKFYTGPQGEITGFPWQFTTILLGYNREYFARQGVTEPTEAWTLDDMVEAARKLTYDHDGDGETDRWGLHVGVLREYVWRLWGVDLMSAEGRSNLGDPRAIAAFEWFADLFLVHQVVGGEGGGASAPAWVEGAIAMNLNWPHYLTAWGLVMTQEWDIELIPTGPIGRKLARGATAGWAIPASASNPDEAWELLKFLASYDVQLQLLAIGSGGVSLPALAEHWMNRANFNFAQPKALQNRAAMARAYEYASIDRYPPGYSNIWRDIINPAITQMVQGRAAPGVILPEVARQVDAAVAAQ